MTHDEYLSDEANDSLDLNDIFYICWAGDNFIWYLVEFCNN